ncbi:MAG: YybH family protein [Acidobacteriota bacterium]
MKTTAPILLALCLSCFACSPVPQVDREAARRAILEADAQWAKTPPDAKAFTSFFAEEGRLLSTEGRMVTGRAEVEKAATEEFSTPGFSLTWKATLAEVAGSGDVGYSIGTFQLTANGPDGNPVTRTGKYTSIWQKSPEGQWKVLLDAPNFDSPPPPVEPSGGEEK